MTTVREATAMPEAPQHATLVFERFCPAPVERVFAALADPVERASWGTPSETAAFAYDETDFRVGGRDVFRCGSKSNPQYRGVTTYYDIVPNSCIVSSEVIETAGCKLLISMTTTALTPENTGTKIVMTTQLVALQGKDMIEGAKTGNNAALDNLVKALS